MGFNCGGMRQKTRVVQSSSSVYLCSLRNRFGPELLRKSTEVLGPIMPSPSLYPSDVDTGVHPRPGLGPTVTRPVPAALPCEDARITHATEPWPACLQGPSIQLFGRLSSTMTPSPFPSARSVSKV